MGEILVGAKICNNIGYRLIAADDGLDIEDLARGASVPIVQILDGAERAIRDIGRAGVLGGPEQVGFLKVIRTPRSIQILRTALPRSAYPRSGSASASLRMIQRQRRRTIS